MYKNVQHPEINNFVSAFTLEERLKHVAEAKRILKTDIPWICDSMENSIKKAFGGFPNGEFVIDPKGKIVRKRFWSNPKVLRKDLEELIGPVEKITKVGDLPAAFKPEPRDIASGVVPRIELPAGLTPLSIELVDDGDTPYFAKLRAEATRDLLRDGDGKLYLAVYLDPLYKVHWNNLAGRVKVKVYTTGAATVSPSKMESPKVSEDADIDPRQFLIEVSRGGSARPLEITVEYVACDDAETFCKDVKQKYKVHFKSTQDLGGRPGIFMPSMFGKVRELDKNGDGDITKDELAPGSVTLYIGHMDYNGNEIIEKEEIDDFLKMFNNGRGFDSNLNDGQKPKKEKSKDEAKAESKDDSKEESKDDK